MMDPKNNDRLHLPSLSVSGFRGLDCLSIRRLGRVTLLAGQNGVGKTTVLDAVRTYAARGRPRVLHDLLDGSEEFVATASDENRQPLVFADLAALFHGRGTSRATAIVIGPEAGKDELTVEESMPGDWSEEQMKLLADLPADPDVQALKIRFRDSEMFLPWTGADERRGVFLRRSYLRSRRAESEWPEAVLCESVGPDLVNNNDLARFWDSVALTEDENFSVQALRPILGSEIERIAVVGSDGPRRSSRRVVVKLREHARPVPLKSLGDGATRMFGVALALTNSRDGILVIDEAENGLHYAVQTAYWRMVLRAAHEGNVQVLATTHSWDCVKGFTRAAAESEDIEGVLVRLERDEEGTRAVEYSEEELEAAADQEIEVR